MEFYVKISSSSDGYDVNTCLNSKGRFLLSEMIGEFAANISYSGTSTVNSLINAQGVYLIFSI